MNILWWPGFCGFWFQGGAYRFFCFLGGEGVGGLGAVCGVFVSGVFVCGSLCILGGYVLI